MRFDCVVILKNKPLYGQEVTQGGLAGRDPTLEVTMRAGETIGCGPAREVERRRYVEPAKELGKEKLGPQIKDRESIPKREFSRLNAIRRKWRREREHDPHGNVPMRGTKEMRGENVGTTLS